MPVVGLFDLVRISSLKNIFNPSRSFLNSWNNNLKSEILSLLDLTDQKTSRQTILDLGAQMRDIFQTGGTNSRGQGSAAVSNSLASTAGYGWERFATWYLNVLSAGTNCVAMIQSSQTKLLPDSFRDAFAVTINNQQVSSVSVSKQFGLHYFSLLEPLLLVLHNVLSLLLLDNKVKDSQTHCQSQKQTLKKVDVFLLV